MKHARILIFSISFCFFFISFSSRLFAQNDDQVITVQDTTKHKKNYGLRIGGDLSKLVRWYTSGDYKGFELNGDFRITKNWYAAAEIGFDEKINETDFLNSKTSGSYLKIGADYNMYTNWLDMDNMIYAGFRVGTSTFSQEINSYKVYTAYQYWEIPTTNLQDRKYSGLNAIWVEVQLGIKVELLKNLYAGLQLQIKRSISQDQPPNFENLFIPGFNRTYDSGAFGFGYGYSLSYRIPIFKK